MEPAALPPLRDELTLHPGPVGVDGAPTWILHDPLRNLFFRLSWPAFEVLSRWHLGEPEAVAEAVSFETTLDIVAEDVEEVVEFFARGQLLKPVSPTDTRRLLAIRDGTKSSWLTWLLHHYLFFRIPLVRPDTMLGELLPFVAWLGGRGFRLATLAALLAGLFLVGRQWNAFATTFVDHFSLTGLASFGVALGLAKIVHELGHAFTAKALGCRVPTMGAAFLVMMPVLYTDCNEAWKLADRRHRLLIGAAGILAELALAVWATLAWGLLPEGAVRGMAFTLAATTWITSVAMNISPFMRFDGYFLAMDALDTPNLHGRSFALAQWWLRETLFGLGEPVPERLPARRQAVLIAFAFAVWIYRLILFLGIAVLVYHFFIKIVGVFLFAVEIGWFVIKPFAMEFAEWCKRADAILASRRSRIPFGVAGGLLLLLAIPWSGRISAPAMLKAGDHVVLFAPAPAILKAIVVAEGQPVEPGTVVAELENPDLDHRLAQANRRLTVLRYESSSVSFEESFRGRSQAIAKELEAAQAELTAVTNEKARLALTASLGGVVADISPTLQPGQWIAPKEPILVVRDGGHAVLDAFVAEDDLPRIVVGMSASFLPEGSHGALSATVESIDRGAVRSLSEPALGAPFGGAIPARIDRQSMVPDAAFYRVRLSVPPPSSAVPVSLRGDVHIDGERHSLLGHAFRAVAAAVIREWGT